MSRGLVGHEAHEDHEGSHEGTKVMTGSSHRGHGDHDMNRLSVVIAIAVLIPRPAAAQSSQGRFELGAQVTSTISREFDDTDVGVGGRVAWRPHGPIGVEGELDFYPRDFPGQVPFSRSRVEGLFGVTAGPHLSRVRPFVRLRPGFVVYREAPRPFACILIFPPPLSCALASGRTMFALDVGGGMEVSATRKTFVRVDVGDRLLKYPGPVFDSNRTVQSDGFIGHDVRFAAGVGLRF
jgi:hypothetical protein